MKLKEILYTQRQRISGHRKEWLENVSRSSTSSRAEDVQHGGSTSRTSHESRRPDGARTGESSGITRADSHGVSQQRSEGTAESAGQSQTLVPVHEDFIEVSRKTYYTFDEQRTKWAQQIRKRRTGEAFGKFRDDERLYDISVDHHPIAETSKLREHVEELKQRNFESDLFLSKARVEQESEKLRELLLCEPPIDVRTSRSSNAKSDHANTDPISSDPPSDDESLFA